VNDTKYRTLLLRAKSMQLANDRPNFWEGYIRGLRRAHYGDHYGTAENHRKWLTPGGDDVREETSHGYREGFAGR
jgi:hypothetical protein